MSSEESSSNTNPVDSTSSFGAERKDRRERYYQHKRRKKEEKVRKEKRNKKIKEAVLMGIMITWMILTYIYLIKPALDDYMKQPKTEKFIKH